MAKLINGSLYVDAYTPTGNPGEYTFENAIYNSVSDNGNGAYNIELGYVVFVAASDINTFSIITGVSNRYKLTTVVVNGPDSISGTMLWDEIGEEIGVPTNGVTSIISQTSSNLRLAVPAIDNYYIDITSGSTLAAMQNDTSNIIDVISNNSTHPMQGVVAQTFSFAQAMMWQVKHNLLTINFTETVTNSFGERIYAAITIIDNTEFIIEFTEPESGSVNVMFFVNN